MQERRTRGTEAWHLRAAVLALSVVSAALAFAVWGLPAHEGKKPGEAADPWRGIWPQDSRQEAEQAQLAADRGDLRSSWQLGFDPDEVVHRYAREVLGWRDPQPLVDNIGPDWVRETLLIECAPGPHPDYPEIACGLPEDRIYAAVNLTVERLVRRDRGGIWIVTESEPTVFHQPAPSTKEEVRTLVTQFLEARVRGSGAEAHLSADGRREYGRRQQMGPLYSGYDRYGIASIDGPLWPLGEYEVGVRLLFAATGASDDETLFVGARSDFSKGGGRLLVLGGRPGLSGP